MQARVGTSSHDFTLVPGSPDDRLAHTWSPKDAEALSEAVRAQLELRTCDEL